ncbi:peptide deformylase [Actinocorallia sp. API 0066]|uniref:peptide deformylase n=1 Tax=Actinocorallia sp. API 0066 TaxID=2896846 RepID=UPI001E34CBFA|nr:peptide deformylase [Actinocorallia sp. API 0066]MCD0448833.1 peptide deformylase [Actinocorallia sp. API 0066]
MSGNVRPITLIGDPVLHRPLKEVTEFDDALRQLADDMFASMYAANGVGLAANQIGVDLRIFVYDCVDDHGEQHKGVVVNPTVEFPDRDRTLDNDSEGCLSVPGPYADVARVDHVHCHGFDLDGDPVSLHGTGQLARCFQHETDHLNGKLYVDRIPAKARKQVLREYEARKAEAAASS